MIPIDLPRYLKYLRNEIGLSRRDVARQCSSVMEKEIVRAEHEPVRIVGYTVVRDLLIFYGSAIGVLLEEMNRRDTRSIPADDPVLVSPFPDRSTDRNDPYPSIRDFHQVQSMIVVTTRN